MNSISIRELYTLYIDVLDSCNSELYNRSDSDVECILFEDCVAGFHSFFHASCLKRLKKAGYIDRDIMEASRQIRTEWIALQERDWTIGEVRSHKAWQKFFALCDKVRRKVRRQP